MNIKDMMKLDAASLAHDARLLRKWELKAKNRALKARAKGKNYPHYEEQQSMYQSERMPLKRDARLLHLARAYVKGQDYHVVEQSTKAGNEVDPEFLVWELCSWGYTPDFSEVKEWLA